MSVTNIPNVTNWSVTPQNGQVGYFALMNTWLSESTAVIASLQTAITAQNTANVEVNQLAIQTENNANIAASVGNYQGVWSDLVTYSKSMGVSVGSLYYISKVDNNLNHVVTDTNYWLPNPINDKLDKDFSILMDKTTPTDTDIFVISEVSGLIKKLSWTNIKASLDSLYVKLTGNQSIDGIKTFTSSPIVPTPTAQDNSTKAATTAYVDGKMVLSTAVTASGTAIDFTSIPSWVDRITIMFNGVSTIGSSFIQVQLGDSEGIENTGYACSYATFSASTLNSNQSATGFPIYVLNSSDSKNGSLILTRLNSNTWVGNGGFQSSGANPVTIAMGSKTLSATLDRVRITTVNGADTFDGGSINIMYEG